jgi:hypothetical protein
MADAFLPPGPTRRGARPDGWALAANRAARPTDGVPSFGGSPFAEPSWATADGAGRSTPDDVFDDDPTVNETRRRVRSWRQTAARVRAVEGERGMAVRWSVGLRYLAYVGLIITCVAVTNATFRGTAWSMGGTLMLFSAAVMCVTAALGSMFMPQKRVEIAEELKHFLFQISVLPGTGIAVFIWVMNGYMSNPQNQDNFLGLLHNSLPILYAFTVFFPAIVFIKAVAGRRTLDRTQQDDSELMATWTRQDRRQL